MGIFLLKKICFGVLNVEVFMKKVMVSQDALSVNVY